LPRAWSKYSSSSSRYQQLHGKPEEKQAEEENDDNKSKASILPVALVGLSAQERGYFFLLFVAQLALCILACSIIPVLVVNGHFYPFCLIRNRCERPPFPGFFSIYEAAS